MNSADGDIEPWITHQPRRKAYFPRYADGAGCPYVQEFEASMATEAIGGNLRRESARGKTLAYLYPKKSRAGAENEEKQV